MYLFSAPTDSRLSPFYIKSPFCPKMINNFLISPKNIKKNFPFDSIFYLYEHSMIYK